jgi:tetraacyldisaccharide 4'-kinase
MLPFGRWREPVASLSRADAVILTRASERRAGSEPALPFAVRTFTAMHELGELRCLPGNTLTPLAQVKAQPVFALTAIAQPQHFIDDLQTQGFNIVAQQIFADHHRYTLAEIQSVIAAAQRAGARAILTTEKDTVNLPDELWQSSLLLPLYALQLRFRVNESEALRDFVLSRIQPSPQLS